MGSSVRLALDYAATSRRTVDLDGRLHVSGVPLTMAAVNVYAGFEIPDAEALGLDPNQQYRLFRDPDEIAKAASSFNNVPILDFHVAVTASDYRPDAVVGATGSNATFDGIYLRNEIVIWSADSINKIESGEQREISSGYRYTPVMQPGSFEGWRYDGIMTSVVANHVAVVASGRAGPTVSIAADHALKIEFPNWNRLKN